MFPSAGGKLAVCHLKLSLQRYLLWRALTAARCSCLTNNLSINDQSTIELKPA